MTLTYKNGIWYREVAMDPSIKFAIESESGHIVSVHDDGRVLINDSVELTTPETLALHNPDPNSFKGYPVPHSGDGRCIAESNGYVTFAWMGESPEQSYGTPIYLGVWREGREPVRYLLHFAGAVLLPDVFRGVDNHCFPQVFTRASDSKIVYLSGGHHSRLYVGVSNSPHAGFNFHGLYPVGPVSDHPANGHSYPAAVMVGDDLHVVSRFTTDGYKFHLVYWKVDTNTFEYSDYQVLQVAPEGHAYAIWYQDITVDVAASELVIEANMHWRTKITPLVSTEDIVYRIPLS